MSDTQTFSVKFVIISEFQNPIIAKVSKEDQYIILNDPMIVINNRADNQTYLLPFPPLAKEDQDFYVSYDKVIISYDPDDKVKEKYLDLLESKKS